VGRWGAAVLCCVVAAGLGYGAGDALAGTPKGRGYFETGRFLVENGRPQEGLLYVGVAVAIAPTDLAAQTYLLTVLDRECCGSDLGLHEALHAVLPNYGPVSERLALLREGQERYEEAGALHLQAAGLPPDDAESQARLGTYYLFVGRQDLARAAFARARALRDSPRWRTPSLEPDAETGNPMAMFVTGRNYIVNAANSGRTDWLAQGLAYLERSARAGFTPARRFLATLYLEGDTVPRDLGRGIAHLERAASAGDVIAQWDLADRYFDGNQVPQNLSRAVYWYQTVLNNPNAGQNAYKNEELWQIELRLADLFRDGRGVEHDPARARALWEHAARASKAPQALRALAAAFEKGIGGAQRDQSALMLYAAAAKRYLDHGYEYGLAPQASKQEAGAVLLAMERIQPKGALTREVRDLLQRPTYLAERQAAAGADPVAPEAPAGGSR
jgi:TPR repeat protein